MEKKKYPKEIKTKPLKIKEEVLDYSNFNNDYSNLNLDQLNTMQERIDDQIEILKGEESLKNHDGYTMEEVELYVKKCINES